MSLLATPCNGLTLQDHDDPHGNGQPTVEIVHIGADGSVAHSGLYISVHGGGPLNLRAVHGNGADSSVFEVGGDGRIAISEL